MNTSSTTAPASGVNVLPLPPAITPAIGIAGGILILTGLGYGLIGIKHRLVYIFFSCAYLTSLSVVILIIFVTSPPISNAIQGALFVAACVSGLMVGGLSLIFKEITEGLGCLLGGFCIAMWLMTLRVGGLIHSQGGTAAFIILISVASYALSFTRHTKFCSLIACSSFAGATVTVLGIDCFSEAGLKEFWMYIWGLNDKYFPDDTNTYPLTRGIRAEIGCIPVLFLFGLISQFSVWKVVKERRDQKEAEKARLSEDREKFEADVGKRIEEANAKDLRVWEATYGDKKSPRVSHTSVGPASPSSRTHRRSSSNNFTPVRRPASKHIQKLKASPVDQDEISILQNTNTAVFGREASDDSVQISQFTDADASSSGQRRSVSLQNDYPRLRPKSVPPPPFTEETDLLDELKVGRISEVGSRNHSFVGMNTDQAWIPASKFSLFWPNENESTEAPSKDVQSVRKDSRLETSCPTTHFSKSRSITTDDQQDPIDEDELFDFERINSGDEVESIQNSKAAEEDMHRVRHEQNTRRSSDMFDLPASPRTGIRRQELEDLPQRIPKKATLHRTNEWAKLLNEAEEPELEDEQKTGCASSICTSDHERIEQAESLWTDFEGTHVDHTSTSIVPTIQRPQKALKKPEDLLVQKTRDTKHAPSRSPTTPTKNPVLPPSTKSARVNQRNASLPALTTTATPMFKIDTASSKRRRQSATNTSDSGTSTPQNSIYPSSSGVSTERPNDGDDMTLSARRKSLQEAQKMSSSTRASTVSSGPHTVASSTAYTPVVQTPNTVYTSSTTTSPLNACPVFAMTALPLRNAYPVPLIPSPQMDGDIPPVPPLPETSRGRARRQSQAEFDEQGKPTTLFSVLQQRDEAMNAVAAVSTRTSEPKSPTVRKSSEPKSPGRVSEPKSPGRVSEPKSPGRVSEPKSPAAKSFETQKRRKEVMARKGGLEGAHKEAMRRMQRTADVNTGNAV